MRHQGNATGADRGAGAAFDAVEQAVFVEALVILCAREPVQLLGQQFGRADLGAKPAADAGRRRRGLGELWVRKRRGVDDLDRAAPGAGLGAAIAGDKRGAGRRCGPFPAPLRQAPDRAHLDTVDGAGRHAEVTTRALGGDNGVHLFGRADDGVHGAGLNTFGAADALVFEDKRDARRRFLAVLGVQGQGLDTEQIGQGSNTGCAARRAFVDGVARGDRFGIGPAAGVAALAALRLRQQRVDPLGDAMALGAKTA